MTIFGILNWPLWAMVTVVLAVWHVTLLATTIYLHRCMAHRAVELHPVLSHFFRAWLWLTTGMVTAEWMAVHRKHHAKVETEDDPHSPVTHGLREVLWRGAELYQAECRNPQTIDKFSFGAPDDWIERKLYSRHKNAGLVLLFLLLSLLFGVASITMTALILLCIPLLAAGVINGLGHSVGYRNYECDDAATNIVPIGLIVAGEELHNNHHAYPGSAKFSIRPWEFDVGWMYLRIFSALGLARVVRVAPRPVIQPSTDRAVDLDTVKAVISSRLHVMEHYARKVVVPTHKLERRRATTASMRKTLAVRRELIAGEFMLDAAARERLGMALRHSDTLRIVIEYRNQLQAIWQIAGASHEKLQEALQDWCNRAELSGIRALEEFSWRLRGYSLKAMPV